VLAHIVADKSEAAYSRGDALEKRRKLMATWADYCAKPEKAVGGVGNVTPIGRKASA